MEPGYKNEFGTEIPPHIAKKAREVGCNKPKYVYKEGEWMKYGKFPASSINVITNSHRFSSPESAEAHKVSLGDGWVAFKSPSGSGSRTSKRTDKW